MKFFATILLTTTIGIIYSQTPNWITPELRIQNYPENKYVTGFAFDDFNKNDELSTTQTKLKDLAKNELTEEIVTNITIETSTSTDSYTTNGTEDFNELFHTSIKSEAKAEIAGINIQSYYDKKKKLVYAFAYADRNELDNYYSAKILYHLTLVEATYDRSVDLINQKEKKIAKEELNTSSEDLAKVKYYQDLLLALGNSPTNEKLKINKSADLRNKIIETLIGLNKGDKIYVKGISTLFGTPDTLLVYGVKQELTQQGYRLVTSESNSDWVITVNSKARAFNYTRDIFFSYVDATITLQKDTENIIFQGKLSQKGGSTIDYKKASRKATNPLCKSIGDQLITEMKK